MTFQRPRPHLDDSNRFFWTSGSDGKLRFLQCAACRGWIHPPQPICPHCLTESLAPEPVVGTGVVESFTVNHQPWLPGVPVPYVIARIAIDGAKDVLLTSNVIECPVDEVRIGDRVAVVFEEQDGIFYPLFRRTDASADTPEGAHP